MYFGKGRAQAQALARAQAGGGFRKKFIAVFTLMPTVAREPPLRHALLHPQHHPLSTKASCGMRKSIMRGANRPPCFTEES